MDDAIFRWVSALGFPVVAAIGLGWVLYRLGSKIVDAHAMFLQAHQEQMKRATDDIDEIKERIPVVCKAACPSMNDCDNYHAKVRPA